ncbi:MAG: nuclear transport factor 2 family protein [Segetibacter sp.]
MKHFLSILLITFFSSTAFCQSNKETEVWAKVEALNKAVFETKDSAAIQDLVSNAVTYGHSTGVIENKPVMLHNAIVNAQVYKNVSAERLGANIVGETVIVRYILRADVEKDGNTSPLNISILQVWAKDHGKWRLFARQAVKVDPK